jgi:hypothetical protein
MESEECIGVQQGSVLHENLRGTGLSQVLLNLLGFPNKVLSDLMHHFDIHYQ